jgi:hypothetical protein
MKPFDSRQTRKAVRSGDLLGAVRQKLLTGAQRKALQIRVSNHARKLDMEIQRAVDSEREPDAVANARKLIERYEDAQEKKKTLLYEGIRRAVKEINNNLLFDGVESCLIQVEEFEERKAPNGRLSAGGAA